MGQAEQFEVLKSYDIDNSNIKSIILLAVCLPDSCYPTEIFGQLGSNEMCTTKRDTPVYRAGEIAFM